MSENLFSRLAGYGQNPKKHAIENFTTEVLAYLFNNNAPFKRRFLKLVLEDGRLIRAFQSAEASTQQRLSANCIIDLVLESASRRHLVEVKIGSDETWGQSNGEGWQPQIQRYLNLRLGHVTYLTTRQVSAPDTDNRRRRFRFLRHAHFEDLYAILRPLSGDRILKQFLRFMEEKDMAQPPQLRRPDIAKVDGALGIYRKCTEALAAVRAEIATPFRSNLNRRCSLTRPGLESGSDWAYIRSYLTGYHKGPIRIVGISLTPDGRDLDFNVYIWGIVDPLLKKLGRHLGWEEWDEGRGYSRSIPVRGTPGDHKRMVDHAIGESRRLGRAIQKLF